MTDEKHAIVRLTADVVVFAPDANGNWHVLLIERKWDPYAGFWALPGGHVDEGEDTVDTCDAAFRELIQEAGQGLNVIGKFDLTFVGNYGAPHRDPRGRYFTDAWMVALTEMVTPAAGSDARKAQWFPVSDVLLRNVKVAFDHFDIICDAFLNWIDED